MTESTEHGRHLPADEDARLAAALAVATAELVTIAVDPSVNVVDAARQVDQLAQLHALARQAADRLAVRAAADRRPRPLDVSATRGTIARHVVDRLAEAGHIVGASIMDHPTEHRAAIDAAGAVAAEAIDEVAAAWARALDRDRRMALRLSPDADESAPDRRQDHATRLAVQLGHLRHEAVRANATGK